MDKLGKDGHLRYIAAHGINVGLNDGLMGNSEVGCVVLPLSPYARLMPLITLDCIDT